MEDSNDKSYTVKEVSDLLSLHYTKVYALIKAGTLQAINVSTGSKRNNWRIPKANLLAFMEARKNGQASN